MFQATCWHQTNVRQNPTTLKRTSWKGKSFAPFSPQLCSRGPKASAPKTLRPTQSWPIVASPKTLKTQKARSYPASPGPHWSFATFLGVPASLDHRDSGHTCHQSQCNSVTVVWILYLCWQLMFSWGLQMWSILTLDFPFLVTQFFHPFIGTSLALKVECVMNSCLNIQWHCDSHLYMNPHVLERLCHLHILRDSIN